MALSVYTPTGIVHETSVDFTKRVLTEPVHLVQYDESLPVVAVTCLDAGQYMTLTALDTVSIRMDKGDGTFIYNPALGMSADGHIVYIQITLQMTANYGRFEPVLELLRDGGYGASSPIPMFIDANPVPNEAIQSTSQWESLNDIVARANAIVAGDAVEFTEAETRENINSGENLITMFGKIKKWFSDLGAAAFKAVANNLTTAEAGEAVLDAYQGKLLKDSVDKKVEYKIIEVNYSLNETNMINALNEHNTEIPSQVPFIVQFNGLNGSKNSALIVKSSNLYGGCVYFGYYAHGFALLSNGTWEKATT